MGDVTPALAWNRFTVQTVLWPLEFVICNKSPARQPTKFFEALLGGVKVMNLILFFIIENGTYGLRRKSNFTKNEVFH